MSSAQWSPLSLSDMDDAYDFIFTRSESAEAAQKAIEAIVRTVKRLQTFPLSGRALDVLETSRISYRYAIAGNYLVFYHVDEDQVYVDRVLDGRSNYLRTLRLSDQWSTGK